MGQVLLETVATILAEKVIGHLSKSGNGRLVPPLRCIGAPILPRQRPGFVVFGNGIRRNLL